MLQWMEIQVGGQGKMGYGRGIRDWSWRRGRGNGWRVYAETEYDETNAMTRFREEAYVGMIGSRKGCP